MESVAADLEKGGVSPLLAPNAARSDDASVGGQPSGPLPTSLLALILVIIPASVIWLVGLVAELDWLPASVLTATGVACGLLVLVRAQIGTEPDRVMAPWQNDPREKSMAGRIAERRLQRKSPGSPGSPP